MSRQAVTRGAGPRAPGDNRWVTKTDLTRFLRCPYAFWLLDTGRLSFAQTVTPLQAGLISDGFAFQAQVEAADQPIQIDMADRPAVLAAEDNILWLDGWPALENPDLGLRGLPDGVRTKGRALIPIETKSHRDVLPTDRLELAFYWLLLQPLRKAVEMEVAGANTLTRAAEPVGTLVLRRGGVPEEVTVDLLPHHFEKVARIVDEVRRVRRYGAQPRMCSCSVCAGPMRDEVRRRAVRERDLLLIWGIGRVKAQALEEVGIKRHTDLIGCDQPKVLATLRQNKSGVSEAMLASWCHHAESYARAEAVVFGAPQPAPESFVALDLEYDSAANHIWLIGACIVDGQERRVVQLWADTPEEERDNLAQLARIIDQHPSLPLLTWNGTGADLPHLCKAVARLGLGQLGSIVANHVDLFSYAKNFVRVPAPSLSLGELAAYFGATKVSVIQDGFDALMRYRDYARSPSGAVRDAMRYELLEYNHDDLVGLVATAEGFGRLPLGTLPSHAGGTGKGSTPRRTDLAPQEP
ncbi:MAG: ribonuclease H-like domain-containing protein [Acidimicrobiales bacterium]